MIKNIIQGLVVVTIMLGVGFGVMFSMQKPATPVAVKTPDEDDSGSKTSEVVQKPVEPLPSSQVETSPDEDPLRRIPVTAAPSYTPGAEETEVLARQLADRRATLDRREELLSERTLALDLILEDFRSEQEIVSKLRKSVDTEIDLATKDLAEQARLLDTTKGGNKGKGNVAVADNIDEQASLKKVAMMYDAMAADAAAKIFIRLSQDNLSDTAVRLLAVMKDRQAAKVLAEIANQEPDLAAQLTEKLRKAKTQNAVPTPDATPPAEANP